MFGKTNVKHSQSVVRLLRSRQKAQNMEDLKCDLFRWFLGVILLWRFSLATHRRERRRSAGSIGVPHPERTTLEPFAFSSTESSLVFQTSSMHDPLKHTVRKFRGSRPDSQKTKFKKKPLIHMQAHVNMQPLLKHNPGEAANSAAASATTAPDTNEVFLFCQPSSYC